MISSFKLIAHFNAAHLYHQPQWSEEKNREVFGKCFTDHGHGHNYKLEAEWAEVSDQEILSLKKKLDGIVGVLDHQHLNFDIPEFKTLIPTSENILGYLEQKIKSEISFELLSLKLFETDEIGAEI